MVGSFGLNSPDTVVICHCRNCDKEERFELPYQGFPSWFPVSCRSCNGDYESVVMRAVRPSQGWSSSVGFLSALERRSRSGGDAGDR